MSKLFKLTAEEANLELDNLKMNGDYSGIIELMTVNREMLISANFKVDLIIDYCEQIIKLHNLI